MSHRWLWAVAVVSAALLFCRAPASAAWLDALSPSSSLSSFSSSFSSHSMTSPDYSAVLSSPHPPPPHSSSSSSSSPPSSSPSTPHPPPPPPPPLLPGFTRSLVGLDYALIAPESRTWSSPIESARRRRKESGVPWSRASVAHLISPGRGGGGATFSMSLVKLGAGGTIGPPPSAGAQRFVFVLDGVIRVEQAQGGGGGEGGAGGGAARRRKRCSPGKSFGGGGSGNGGGFSFGSKSKNDDAPRNLTLGADGFAFFPPHCQGGGGGGSFHFLPSVTAGPGGAGLLMFERIHIDRETGRPSFPLSSSSSSSRSRRGDDASAENAENAENGENGLDETDLPFFVWGPSASKLPLLDPGSPETFKLRKLLPHDAATKAASLFDFNVHLMDFDPGEFLVTKEVHHNQHGLLMLLGQGVYRLSNDVWSPVGVGDAIYMGPYVTQFFGALGGSGSGISRYIIFKDTAPDPLLAGRCCA